MKVLVLCTGNSCRSQMAEGFFRHFSRGQTDVKSGGLKPIGLDSRAVAVMKELDIDISKQVSRHMTDYLDEEFDYVITVCDNAAEHCPSFPGPATRLHWPFEDPYFARGTEEEVMEQFRTVRDQIGSTVQLWLKEQGVPESAAAK